MGSQRRSAVGALSVREQSRTDAEQYLRGLNAGLERQARAIGQTLHDEAGQLLTAAYIALAEAARDLPEPAGARLLVVRQHLAAVEEHLRQVAHGLRPRVLDDHGFIAALEFLSRGVETRCGIPVTVRSALTRRLPPRVELAVYRVAQEALTNITKHAHATTASIRVATEPRSLRCTIRDNGVGMSGDAWERGHGLGVRGMRERVEFLGGQLLIKSAPHAGTTLDATIPLER
jgi:two-component system sensor histidine kinase UhpB